MNSISMEYFECSQSSSSSSSSPLQITTPPKILTPTPLKHKKKAGRKVFIETRHPVYRGVRRKNGGKWVCEVREPKKQSRIWLGTFQDPETAALAHDVAALALRGEDAPLNFPDSAGRLPRVQWSSHQDIQRAALLAARELSPSFRFLQEKNNIDQEENSCNSSMATLVDQKNDSETGVMGDSGEEERAADGEKPGVVVGFVDEEEVFNMPVLLDSMAEGMLLTPLAIKKGFNWSQYEVDDVLELNLWGTN